jgi:hypothetical protein
MAAAGIVAGWVPASMSAAPLIMGMAAAMCANWFRRRGDPAGASSIAAIERSVRSPMTQAPARLCWGFALTPERIGFPFIQFLLESMQIDRGRKQYLAS